MVKKVFLYLFFSLMLGHVFAQLDSDYLERREKETEELAKRGDYVDFFSDSLFYNNRILLFRQSPLSLKKGYSKIFPNTDMVAFGYKGCILTWVVRNDSLFLSHVYTFEGEASSEDTIRSRMENFTGGRFIKGLLFVAWITGDLRVISKYSRDFIPYDFPGEGLYADDRMWGSILSVRGGIVTGFKEDRTNGPFGQSNIIQRERAYEKAKNSRPFYVDAEPDTLYRNGRMFFFRQSPLSLKQGYTDIFHEDEVSVFNRRHHNIVGLKGYNLTWVIRNDSLFISDIYPTYYDPKRPTLCRDTITARMEAFTGGRFVGGLLFVNWISGEFGVMTKHFRSIYSWTSDNYKDDRKEGSFMRIEKGLVTAFWEKDTRDRKN